MFRLEVANGQLLAQARGQSFPLTGRWNRHDRISTNAVCKQTDLLWEAMPEAERGFTLELDQSQQLMHC